MMSDTKLVKLISGEELIATVDEGTTTIDISEALAVIPQPPQPGQKPDQMGFAFIPWGSLVAEGNKITIKREHVIYIAEATHEIVSRHQQLFGKIQTAPKGLTIVKR